MTGRELTSRLGVQDPSDAKYRDFCAWLKAQGVERTKTKAGTVWTGVGGKQ